MELSARVFGVNSWSILVPQALEGVATIGVLYATIKRWFGSGAGLLAGAVLAVTPVAALMFRFNNPDALLALLLVLGAYALTRALEDGRTRWLVLAGVAVGFGFLAKELQAFLVLPAFGLVYLIAGPPQLARRIWQLVLLGLATIASAGWWIAAVQLTPASARPYIGGSQNNSFWNVLFGYNGFGRLTGNESGSVVGGGGRFGGNGGSMWGPTGLTRLFNTEFGGQASWLLPAASAAVRRDARVHVEPSSHRPHTGGRVAVGRDARGDRDHVLFRAGDHPPLLHRRARGAHRSHARNWLHHVLACVEHVFARVVLAGAVALSAVWAYQLLGRTPSWHPALRVAIIGGAIAAALALLLWSHVTARVATAIAVGAVVVGLAAPSAYSLSTASQAHTGAIRRPVRSRSGLGSEAPDHVGSRAAHRAHSTLRTSAAGTRSRTSVATGSPTLVATPCRTSATSVVDAAVGSVGCSTGRNPVRRSRRRCNKARRVPLGGRNRRRERGRELPARVGQGDHGDRWLQRHRPDAVTRGSSSNT